MKKINNTGYVVVNKKLNNGKKVYVLEHRLIVERFIKRKLTSEEVVHHIGSKRNNNIENLWLFKNQKEHSKWHTKLKQFPYLTNSMRTSILNRWKEFK